MKSRKTVNAMIFTIFLVFRYFSIFFILAIFHHIFQKICAEESVDAGKRLWLRCNTYQLSLLLKIPARRYRAPPGCAGHFSPGAPSFWEKTQTSKIPPSIPSRTTSDFFLFSRTTTHLVFLVEKWAKSVFPEMCYGHLCVPRGHFAPFAQHLSARFAPFMNRGRPIFDTRGFSTVLSSNLSLPEPLENH